MMESKNQKGMYYMPISIILIFTFFYTQIHVVQDDIMHDAVRIRIFKYILIHLLTKFHSMRLLSSIYYSY